MPEQIGDMRVNAPDLMRDVTLTVWVQRRKELTARLWLARQLIRAAAWVGGFGRVEIRED